jgi:hypothetical protein
MLFTKSNSKNGSSNSNERFTDITSSTEQMDTHNYKILYLTKPISPDPKPQFYIVSYSQLASHIQSKIIELIESNEITIDSNLNNITDLKESIQHGLQNKPLNDILFAVPKSSITRPELIQSSSTIAFDSDNKPQYFKDSTTLKIIINNSRNRLSHNNTILFIKTSGEPNTTTINDNNVISNFDDGKMRKLIELVPIKIIETTSQLYLLTLTNSNSNNYNITTETLSLTQNV